jgi:hypothetical protein
MRPILLPLLLLIAEAMAVCGSSSAAFTAILDFRTVIAISNTTTTLQVADSTLFHQDWGDV